MVFSKSFPRTTDKSVYPTWEEISLTREEEKEQESLARKENTVKMQESIEDAKTIMDSKNLKHPFKPIVFKDTETLILGTFPSIKSFENNFYYAHPRNQF